MLCDSPSLIPVSGAYDNLGLPASLTASNFGKALDLPFVLDSPHPYEAETTATPSPWPSIEGQTPTPLTPGEQSSLTPSAARRHKRLGSGLITGRRRVSSVSVAESATLEQERWYVNSKSKSESEHSGESGGSPSSSVENDSEEERLTGEVDVTEVVEGRARIRRPPAPRPIVHPQPPRKSDYESPLYLSYPFRCM